MKVVGSHGIYILGKKTNKIRSQMVVKHGDESHGTIRKNSPTKQVQVELKLWRILYISQVLVGLYLRKTLRIRETLQLDGPRTKLQQQPLSTSISSTDCSWESNILPWSFNGYGLKSVGWEFSLQSLVCQSLRQFDLSSLIGCPLKWS